MNGRMNKPDTKYKLQLPSQPATTILETRILFLRAIGIPNKGQQPQRKVPLPGSVTLGKCSASLSLTCEAETAVLPDRRMVKM